MKILLADPSDVWCNALEQQLKCHHDVLRCSDGAEVLPIILEQKPELLILDLMLPNVDGLTILRTLRSCGIAIRVIVASNLFNSYVLDTLSSFEIGYTLQKPCTVCSAMTQIYEIMRYHAEQAETDELDSVLLTLGLRMHLNGYECLRHAVLLMREHPGQSLTKELYPGVAKACGGSAQRVERAIRNAIRDAWQHRDERIWRAYFSLNREGKIPLPSNGEFIVRLAACVDRLKVC